MFPTSAKAVPQIHRIHHKIRGRNLDSKSRFLPVIVTGKDGCEMILLICVCTVSSEVALKIMEEVKIQYHNRQSFWTLRIIGTEVWVKGNRQPATSITLIPMR